MTQERKVIIIAGPNGAGKTTFAREFLPNEAACPVFVNADLIAAGLAPFAPETASVQAGRVMLNELERRFAAKQSFAFETTLSGKGYLRHIQRWQAAGYRVDYAHQVDAWVLFDNSGEEPRLMEWSER